MNDQGALQSASRAIAPPGLAREGWKTLLDLAAALGVTLHHASADQIRTGLAAALGDRPRYAGLAHVVFGRPQVTGSRLEASNPSERLKWEALFKDLPPLKFQEGSDAPAGGAPGAGSTDRKPDGNA